MTIKLITIQGNIGSGKSTIVHHLKKIYGHKKNICFLQEPVDIWNTITDRDGTSIISLYYENQKEYAFSFQMMAYISRLSILKKAVEDDYDYIISERSLETDKHVFAKMLYDEKKINHVEYQIYLKWFDEFKDILPKEHIVYIKTYPNTVYERVNKRARQGENIPIEYLEKCHKYHEDWILRYKDTLLIDGNIDIHNPIKSTLGLKILWIYFIRTLNYFKYS